MKILVPVKRVPDYATKVKIAADGCSIVHEGVKWIVNPFDEIAVEEALKIKEASAKAGGAEVQVIVALIGPADAEPQLRYVMAMGADSAVHVVSDIAIDSDMASRALAAVFKRSDYNLILMGKQSIDSDANQTAQLLAARLNLSQACFASKVVLASDKATVTREVDGGLETIAVPLPCVISTDLRLNQPRYASLPGIMKAKKKPIEQLTFGDLGVEGSSKIKILKMSLPAVRQAGKKVDSVVALVKALKEEAQVI